MKSNFSFLFSDDEYYDYDDSDVSARTDIEIMKEIFWLWRRDLLQPFCRDRTMLYISICFLAFLEYSSRDCFSSLILATHIGRKIRVEFKKMVAFEEILQEI